MFEQEPFLYLTTIGWKTQNPHEIEIWFVYHDGCFYLVSENRERSHWVKNLQHNSRALWRVAGQHYAGRGRTIDPDEAYDLAHAIWTLMDAKYQWSDGLIVELCPDQSN